MREIEFRAKDKTGTMNYSWFYGALDNTDEMMPLIMCQDRFNNTMYIQVDPKTIGQYTGLKDKNGTKIFEDDIVKGYCTLKNKEMIGAVCFDLYNGLELKTTDGNMWHFDHMKDIEVIGNVFDNGDLTIEN